MSHQRQQPLLHRSAVSYVENSGLRAVVQLIPQVGGAIDALLAGKGAAIQQDRLNRFLETLDHRIRVIENKSSDSWSTESEELFDFVLITISDAIKIRSAKKMSYLAGLAASQVVHPRAWSQAEAAERILTSLDDVHIEVLLEVSNAPEILGVWNGTRVITINNPEDNSAINPTYLPDILPGYQLTMLRLACAELLAKGLLLDEGVGRLSVRSMTYFVISDLGKWFLEWLYTEPCSSGDLSPV